MPQEVFETLRRSYPVFRYERYTIEPLADRVRLTFTFTIDGLCTFSPSTEIETGNLTLCNAPDSPAARAIAFHLGLVELISYWKAACPPQVVIACGHLSEEDVSWWKKLYFHGLSEFFYRNDIQTTPDDFMQITCSCPPCPRPTAPYVESGIHLIPVGGGKDSCVTAELLRSGGDKNRFFTVNDQPARTDTVLAAGYSANDMVRTHRTIDPQLLALNKKGFLNGHTPFSAIVAFLAYYCAYLLGAKDIVLSNESSANESNIAGTEVNHQYSKSYAFECDFAEYCARNLVPEIQYFSLLRPFSELQIAKQFAAFPRYHASFRSCNRGSKENVWCGKCAKCLFVFSILSPFLPYARLCALFGADMLDDEALRDDFDGLCGFSPVKPFECVGTAEEITYALHLTAEKRQASGEKMPKLLTHFLQVAPPKSPVSLLDSYNPQNNVPPALLPLVKEMYAYVSADC